MGLLDALGEIVKLPFEVVEKVAKTAKKAVDEVTGNDDDEE